VALAENIGRKRVRQSLVPIGGVRGRGQRNLFEVVLALDRKRRGADLLHRWKEQADQQRHDPDDNEEFDQSDGATHPAAPILTMLPIGDGPPAPSNRPKAKAENQYAKTRRMTTTGRSRWSLSPWRGRHLHTVGPEL